MSTVTSRRLARVALAAAGIAGVVLGVISAVSNRVTGPEAAGWFAVLIVGSGAAAWLRGTGRRSP